jgi:LysM repeat protein
MSSRRTAAASWVVAPAVVIALFASCDSAREDDQAAARVETTQHLGSGPSAGASYTIRSGDYLSGIADEAGVSLGELVAVNGWPEGADHPIFPGDVIRLPAGADVPTGGDDDAGTDEPAAAAGQAAVDACANGRFFDSYTPIDGDTIETVATKVGASVDDINRANGFNVIDAHGGPATLPGGVPLFGAFTVGEQLGFPCRRNWPDGVEFAVVPEGEVCSHDTSRSGDYLVQPGDTPASLAARWGISEQVLFDANSSIHYPAYPDVSVTSVLVRDGYRSFQPGDKVHVCTGFWGQ